MKKIQKLVNKIDFTQKRSSYCAQEKTVNSQKSLNNKESTYEKLSNSLKKIKEKICAKTLEKNEERKLQFQEKPTILPKSRELAKANGPLYSTKRLQEVKRNHSIKYNKLKQTIDIEQTLKKTRDLTPIFKKKPNKKSLSLCFDADKIQSLVYSQKSYLSPRQIQIPKNELFIPKIDKNSRKIVEEVRILLIFLLETSSNKIS
jgi:hypothetical protein